MRRSAARYESVSDVGGALVAGRMPVDTDATLLRTGPERPVVGTWAAASSSSVAALASAAAWPVGTGGIVVAGHWRAVAEPLVAVVAAAAAVVVGGAVGGAGLRAVVAVGLGAVGCWTEAVALEKAGSNQGWELSVRCWRQQKAQSS